MQSVWSAEADRQMDEGQRRRHWWQVSIACVLEVYSPGSQQIMT